MYPIKQKEQKGDSPQHVRTAGGMASTIATSTELEGFSNACEVDFNRRIVLRLYREQPIDEMLEPVDDRSEGITNGLI
jgi:hypothetical protein